MLVLSRNVGQTICIGDDVRLTVFGVRGNQVRFGVRAPDHVSIHREEIYHRIKAEEQRRSSEK